MLLCNQLEELQSGTRGPVRSGFPGQGLVFGGEEAEVRGAGFHLSLMGLLLPPAAASQPRAFPPPPDHIGLRGAEPQSPPKECASLGGGDEPGGCTVGLRVCQSVRLFCRCQRDTSAPRPLSPYPRESQRAEGELSKGTTASGRLSPIPAPPPSSWLLSGPAPQPTPPHRSLSPPLLPAQARTPLAF